MAQQSRHRHAIAGTKHGLRAFELPRFDQSMTMLAPPDSALSELFVANEDEFHQLLAGEGLTGAAQDKTKGEWSNFWSNRVKDTRTQPYTLYVNGQKTQFSGLRNEIYEGVTAQYGKAVKNVRVIIAYCKELDAVVEIPLTAFAERGVKKSIADSQNAHGKKIKWENVKLYGLADNEKPNAANSI